MDQCTIFLPTLPLSALEEIFLNVPPHKLVCVCRFVCREWKEVVDSQYLWKERCRREGYQPCDTTKLPDDWRLFYFMCKKRRNLIKNPKGDEGFRYWQITKNGGDKWSIENVRDPHPDVTVQKIFITSYMTCLKSQLIHLEAEGYPPLFMDQFQPDIKISDWCTPRSDCGCRYKICVHLLNQRKEQIQTFKPDPVYFQQWNDQPWEQITQVFRNYGPGVRYIMFTHGGEDTQGWAGWYGIRVTNSSVEICPCVVK